jgi:hypothetical protein
LDMRDELGTDGHCVEEIPHASRMAHGLERG